MAVLMAIVDWSRKGLLRLRRAIGPRFPAKLFDRAEADSIGFPESSIDGAGLCYAHLGAADER